VAGKGGVGKSTVAAALAVVAADAGLRTLLVDVEGTAALPALFGREAPLGYVPVTLREGRRDAAAVTGRTITPDDALLEYLDAHGLRRVSKRMTTTGTLDLVATAIPGIKDVLVLGKVKQLEQVAAAGGPEAPELVVVDAPAAGHAVTFLASAHGLVDAIGVGPIRAQAADVVALLRDPARCQVVLVTLPEETPVNEATETAFHLEDRAGVKLGPVVVNGLYPRLHLPVDVGAAAAEAGVTVTDGDVAALGGAAEFRRRRQALQDQQVDRLRRSLPLPQLHLPHLWTADLGADDVERLAGALGEAIDGLDADVAA